MEFIRGRHGITPEQRGCVATIGNFDGVHRGHQAVLAALRAEGERLGLPTTLITFEPHPREFFGIAPPRLTALRDKLCALADCGIDRVLCLPFNRRLAAMAPERFAEDLLVAELGVRHLMVGDDFRFGRERRGDFDLLARTGRAHGFQVERMPTVTDGGERISSSRVRAALRAGDLDAVTRLLGRPYGVSARVARGDALGRTLGWPTANLRFRGQAPLTGIYTVDVRGVPGHANWPGVASVGTRPTVDGTDARLEIHLLDYDGDLYGRHLSAVFLDKLREEERFDSLDALTAQIGRDVERARRRFADRQSATGWNGTRP